mgnify:FL=1
MWLQENTLFADRYQLVRLLGRGGFSEVWLAEDRLTGLKVAIKVYAPGTGLDSDGMSVFSKELSLVYNLHHTNLLKPQHFDQCNNRPYLVLPYCEQGSALKLVGQMPEEEAWRFLRDVAAGLEYLHALEPPVIHQDIKPDNVLRDSTGTFMITDFGISTKIRSTLRKSVNQAENSGGTMAYMGPERFSKHPMAIMASDVWALGATLFELLSGDPPFGDLGGVLQQKGAEIPEVTGNYSPELKKAVEACLAKEPWDRPTAHTLREYAETYLSGKKCDWKLFFAPKADREKNPSGPKKPEQEEKKHSDPDKTLPVGKEKIRKSRKGVYIGLAVALIVIGIGAFFLLVPGIDREQQMWENCSTQTDYENYVSVFPQGKYLSEAHQKIDSFSYNNCQTLQDYEHYLATHPLGRYADAASYKIDLLRQSEEERKQKERIAAQKGWIDIKRMEFVNMDSSLMLVGDFGATLYATDIYYLLPQLIYNVLSEEPKTIELDVKLFHPNGELMHGQDSPSGYTYTMSVTTVGQYKQGEQVQLLGWGSKTGGIYTPGRYRWEVWYKGKKLHSTSVELLKKAGEVTYLNVSPTSVSFDGSGGTRTFYVSTDGDSWSVDYLPDWCSVTKSSTSFQLKCESNPTTERTDWFKVNAGDKSVKITVTQKMVENTLSRGTWKSAVKRLMGTGLAKTYTEGDTYKGQLNSSGVRQGMGFYRWKDGDFYAGGWGNGAKDGFGIYLVNTEGSYVSACEDCIYYVGYWKNGKKSGKGTCYDKFGNLIYYGNFSDDKPTETYPMSGYDAYKFECFSYEGGDKYLGETKDGKRSGYGIYLWENGSIWVGNWSEGERNGYGIYVSLEGTITTGTWDGNNFTAN